MLYSAVRFGITPAVNALATIMLALTAVAVIITGLVVRRSRGKAAQGDGIAQGFGAAIGI